MWYEALERKELQRIYDGLSRQLGKLCDTLRDDGLDLPPWAADVAADLNVIHNLLWRYRLASAVKEENETENPGQLPGQFPG